MKKRTKLWIKEQLLSEWFPYLSKEYKREYQHRISWRGSERHIPFTYRQVLWLDKRIFNTTKITTWYSQFTKEQKQEYHRKKYHEYKIRHWQESFSIKYLTEKIKKMREQQNIIL